jgi:hypothetical protein
MHTVDAERQALNLSLVAIGAGLGVIPFLSGPTVFIVLLVLPFVFHIILWEMLGCVKTLSRISNYLTMKLIPRVNHILDELGSRRQNTMALGWEVHIAAVALNARELLLTTLTPTRHWMPILTIAALLIAYSLSLNLYQHTPTTVEVGLIILNLLFLIGAAIQNLITVNLYRQRTQTLQAVGGTRQAEKMILPKSKRPKR